MLDDRSIPDFAMWYISFLIALTFHEAAHALLAWRGGDDTAYRGGQVSLNPWPHIRQEPMGTVVVPVLSYILAGWTLGWATTPTNVRWGERFPLRRAAMLAAGPGANLILALISFGALKGLFIARGLAKPALGHLTLSRLAVPAAAYAGTSWAVPLAGVLSITFQLNFILTIFNLLPIPPMDGSGILAVIFPRSVGYFMGLFKNDLTFSVLGLFLAWKVFPGVYDPALGTMLRMLYG
jgi:Zn-dependent protease